MLLPLRSETVLPVTAITGTVLEPGALAVLTARSIRELIQLRIENEMALWRYAMSDETKGTGLGKVIYKVDEKDDAATQREDVADRAEVEEAVEESFPASDPPSFAGGNDCTST